MAAEPGYRDAQALLDQARRQQTLAELRAEAEALHHAEQWQAVLAVGERLTALAPGEPDPGGLISSARAELQAAERARALAEAYQRALQHLGAKRWRAALRELATIQETKPGYQDSVQLAAQARRELARAAPISDHPVKIRTIRAPNEVNAVAFSPDGTRLALACDGQLALVMDLAGREQLQVRHEGSTDSVWSVAFDRADGRFATAGSDGTARIWDTTAGKQLLTVTHNDTVRGVAFSPDGGLLATCSRDQTVQIWRLVEDSDD